MASAYDAQFAKTPAFQQLTVDERKAAMADFDKLSDGEKHETIRALGGTPQTVMPSAGERASAAVPTAGRTMLEGLKNVLGMAGDEVKRGLATTPGAEVLRTVQTLRGHDRERDMLDTITPARPSGKELAAQAVGIGAGALGGAVAGKLTGSSLPTRLARTGLDLAANYGGRRANVELGLEEPGKAGDIASVAVPAAIRGAGALASLGASPARTAITARDSAYGTTLDDLSTQADTQQRTSTQKRLTWDDARREYLAKNTPKDAAKEYLDQQVAYGTRVQKHQEAIRSQGGPGGTTDVVWGGARAKAPERIQYAYDAVRKSGDPSIPWDKVRAVAKEVTDEISAKTVSQDNTTYKVAKALHDMGKEDTLQWGQNWSWHRAPTYRDPQFSEVWAQLSGAGGLGQQVGEASNDSTGRLVRKLYTAVMDAMDEGGGDSNALLRQANRMYRRDRALARFERVFTPGVPGSAVTKNDRNQYVVSPRTAFNAFEKLKQDSLFKGAFSARELDTIDRELSRLVDLEPVGKYPTLAAQGQQPSYDKPPPVPPTPVELPARPQAQLAPQNWGANFGRAAVIGQGVVSPALYAAGMPYPANVIAGSGMEIGAEQAARVFSQALLSREARPYVRKLLSHSQIIKPEELAAMNMLIRQTATRHTEED